MENGKNPEDQYVVLRSDRRKNLRKQLLVLKIRGEDQRGVFFGYGKTISRGGMFVASVNPRQIGEEFEVRFTLTDEEKTEVKCKCTVVWRREYQPHKEEPGMGIKFVDLSDEIRDKIEEWIKKKS